MKRYFIFTMLLFTAFAAYADSLNVGVVTLPGDAYSVISLNNNYSDDTFEYSVDLNCNLSNKDLGMESVVLRSFEYDNGTIWFNYRPLDMYNVGYGLLVNNLSTDLLHPSFPRNDHSALITSYDGDWFYTEAFGTYSHLYGVQVNDINILGLKFGFEAVCDAATAERTAFSRSVTGAFVELPLNDLVKIYGEVASSANGGIGTLTGVEFSRDMIMADFSLTVSAVSFNNKFIPGYFTSGYDVNPLDVTLLETADIIRFGQITTFSTMVIGLIDLDLTNENYVDGGSATSWAIMLTPTDQLKVSAFQKEFAFSDYRRVIGNAANIIGIEVGYDLGFGIASATFKKGITADVDKPFETSYITIGFSL